MMVSQDRRKHDETGVMGIVHRSRSCVLVASVMTIFVIAA
jgi:hypothetical protein